MNSFYKLLNGIPAYNKTLDILRQNRGTSLLTGLTNTHKAHFIYALCTQLGKNALVIAPNEPSALKLCEDINALNGAETACFLPAKEFVWRDVESASREYEYMRLQSFGRLLYGGRKILVASAESALQYTIPPGEYRKKTKILLPGEAYRLEDLISFFINSGYKRCEQVEGAAQFSVRGGILDFFPSNAKNPIRVEFWGDEIDTISSFSVKTQRSEDTLGEALITPAREFILPAGTSFIKTLEGIKKNLRGKYGVLAKELIDRDIEKLDNDVLIENGDKYAGFIYENPATALDYFADDLMFLCEPVSCRENIKNSSFQLHEDIVHLMSEGVLFKGADTFSGAYSDIERKAGEIPAVIMDVFMRSAGDIPLKLLENVSATELSPWSGDYNILKEDLTEYTSQGYSVAVFAGTERACKALLSDLIRDKFNVTLTDDIKSLKSGAVYILPKAMNSGAEYPDIKFAIISHSKNLTQTRSRKEKKLKDSKKIKAISELVVGDYVVHSSHGIGIFEGIVKRELHGTIKDYIKIKYAGTDMLFVPVTQLDLVNKYIGAAENVNVRLNKLNSVEWQKTRAKVKSAVKDMAKELMELYSKRANAKGFAFSDDSDWQLEFEERFPYEETEDQLRCVREIKADMQKPTPMDRLLCGDVGFGKTEVALRAVFKCALDGKQCAVLVPTTILAWQHYQTFLQRFEGYPITVELLSRFRSPKEQKDIINRTKKGLVDVVIGTHRIVQKDVEFKNLGLCIVDEEQRFGVTHKEKFKEKYTGIDVLTLSATPIPRTLNMAMSGIRDMSIIEEAPQDRYPVQTYVLEYDLGILAEAIRKELRRGGQVFYIHNRIDTIESCARRLGELVPDARIVTAHGRVGEDYLEEVWQKLVEHKIDILVSTTIIETGVDVPNCNTLIIEDADYMGLGQLYQIRGRVGRSSKRAYAYLTFRKDKALSDIASKRLGAIREFTSFGSGFRIAMRDLELRGAGNILGMQQHGHMAAVGYDLYLKMLSEAVSEETGEAQKPALECMVDIQTDAYLPEDYISSLPQRIDIYKKISAVQDEEDASDIIDELIDRFGDPPVSVKGLIDVALLRNKASMAGIREISEASSGIMVYFESFSIDLAASLAAKMKGRVLVNAGAKPYITVRLQKGQSATEAIREMLGNIEWEN